MTEISEFTEQGVTSEILETRKIKQPIEEMIDEKKIDERFAAANVNIIGQKKRASKKPLTKVQPSSEANSNSTAFANSINDLNSPIEMFTIHEQSIFKAKGTQLLLNNKKNAKLGKDLKSELIMNETVEKEQTEENITAEVLSHPFLSFQNSLLNLLSVQLCMVITNDYRSFRSLRQLIISIFFSLSISRQIYPLI